MWIWFSFLRGFSLGDYIFASGACVVMFVFFILPLHLWAFSVLDDPVVERFGWGGDQLLFWNPTSEGWFCDLLGGILLVLICALVIMVLTWMILFAGLDHVLFPVLTTLYS